MAGLPDRRLRTAGLAAAVILGLGGLAASAGAVSGSVNRPVGFGAAATGGASGPVVSVTSLADDGPGTLRVAATAAGPARIRFAVSGVIALVKSIKVASDKTIDGAGAHVTITGRGLRMIGVHNVIIRHLAITNGGGDSDEDAIQLSGGSRDVWIDHNALSAFPDGLLDITQQSTRVTVSWNRFFNHDKVMLINGADTSNQGLMAGEAPVEVTVAHNLFDGTNQRQPLVRYAHVHAFNNVLRNWGAYGMQSQEGGQLFSQDNVFQAGTAKDAIRSQGQSIGTVRSQGDLLLNGALVTERDRTTVFKLPAGYVGKVQVATAAMRDQVVSQAGQA